MQFHKKSNRDLYSVLPSFLRIAFTDFLFKTVLTCSTVFRVSSFFVFVFFSVLPLARCGRLNYFPSAVE